MQHGQVSAFFFSFRRFCTGKGDKIEPWREGGGLLAKLWSVQAKHFLANNIENTRRDVGISELSSCHGCELGELIHQTGGPLVEQPLVIVVGRQTRVFMEVHNVAG